MKKKTNANLPVLIFMLALLIIWQAGAMGMNAAYILPSPTQILVRRTAGGNAQVVPVATCAKKRTLSPSGRASILKNGLGLHEPSLKDACLS